MPRKRASRAGLAAVRYAVAALLLAGGALAPGRAEAQKVCSKGKPCGRTCIARDRVCHITPSRPGARPPADSIRTRPPADSTGGPAPAAVPAGLACRITRIVDGDTVHCDGIGSVRLILIDTPEMGQGDHGAWARSALEALLPVGSAATLELDVQERDRYGRVLGYLYAGDGTLVNEAMVRRGYAFVAVYPPNVKHIERIRAAAADARAEGRGLWGEFPLRCRPADYRAHRCR